MSSMQRKTFATTLAMLAFSPALAASPALAQDNQDEAAANEDGQHWDQARAQLRALPPGNMVQAIERWKLLSRADGFTFYDYSTFLIAYPGLPEQDKLRGQAEKALLREAVEPRQIAAYFDRFPPLGNPGRAQYALCAGPPGSRSNSARSLARRSDERCGRSRAVGPAGADAGGRRP
jgi:soluble lytic murein transglycosylase